MKINEKFDEHPSLQDRIENAMKDPDIVKQKTPKALIKFIAKKGKK
jgi:hypothetical protein